MSLTWSIYQKSPKKKTISFWWWTNCFCNTLPTKKPIEFGADLVIHSATQAYRWTRQGFWVGLIVGKSDLINEIRPLFFEIQVPALSPFNAWVLSKKYRDTSGSFWIVIVENAFGIGKNTWKNHPKNQQSKNTPS